MRLARLFFFAAFLCSALAFGQEYQALIGEATARAKAKEYPQAVGKFEAAFKLQASNSSDLYNGACAAALAGNAELALAWLQQAVDRGWANPQHTESDPDLNSLHDSPRWKEIVAAMRERRKALDANIDKPLRAQLRAIYQEDQKYRTQLEELEKKSGPNSPQVRELWKTIDKKDAENLAQVKAILDTRGWLGPAVVGNDGASTLFLVIQHADLKTQEKYLPMMRGAVAAQKARPEALALLEDRVAMGEGRRQTYGSQLRSNPKTGKYELFPIEDPAHVDERRVSVGLPPLAEYVKHWDLTWDPVEHLKQHPADEKLGREQP